MWKTGSVVSRIAINKQIIKAAKKELTGDTFVNSSRLAN